MIKIYLTKSCLERTFFLTKWKSNSIFFVHTCRMRFVASATKLKLSHQRLKRWEEARWSSYKSDHIQRNSDVILAILLYPVSMLDLETRGYFLVDQQIGLASTKTQWLEMDHGSSGWEAQSTFEKYPRILLTTI